MTDEELESLLSDLKPSEPELTTEEMYQRGKACHQNFEYADAAKWYRKAAEQGHMQAQLDLGFAYENGLGVEQYSVEAVKWFRKAAEQGYAPAQDRLALRTLNGWISTLTNML